MMFDSNTDTIPKDSTKEKISIAWKILRMLIVEDFGFYNFIALIRSDWCWNFFIFDSDFRFEEGENGTCSQVNRVSAWADSSVNIRPRPFLVFRLWGETKLFCVFAIKSWHEGLMLIVYCEFQSQRQPNLPFGRAFSNSTQARIELETFHVDFPTFTLNMGNKTIITFSFCPMWLYLRLSTWLSPQLSCLVSCVGRWVSISINLDHFQIQL